jgi:hypothetical protein
MIIDLSRATVRQYRDRWMAYLSVVIQNRKKVRQGDLLKEGGAGTE